MDYITLSGVGLRRDLAWAMRVAQEQDIPIISAVYGKIDFCVVPIGFTSRAFHWAMVSRHAVNLHRSVTGIDRGLEAPYILPLIKPEMLRRDLTAQRTRINAKHTPMFMTYHYQLWGILFPIPEGHGKESVLEIAEGWRAIVKTERLTYE